MGYARAIGRLLSIVVALALVFSAGCSEPYRPTGWIGVNSGLAGPLAVTATRPASEAECHATYGLLSELGVRAARDELMNWSLAQPKSDGGLDFRRSDELIRGLQLAGMDVTAVFCGVPAWAGAKWQGAGLRCGVPAREHVERFRAFVTRFVERYDADSRLDLSGLRRPVHAYQFMDEMEDVPAAEYAFWMGEFYTAVKQADPRATVVLGSLRSPGIKLVNAPEVAYIDYFAELLDTPEWAGGANVPFDVVAFNNFPGTYPGRTPFDDSMAYLRQVMAKHKLERPIWLTAYGCRGGGSPDSQSDNLIKWTLRARTLGIEQVYLYSLKDQPRMAGHSAPPGCGLVREGTLEHKPAFAAFTKLTEELKKRPDISLRAQGLYSLTGTGDPKFIIWKEESYDPTKVLIPGWWAIETFTGNRLVRQGREIKPTASPLLIQRTTSPFID